jgi:hypothetical protein
MNPTKFFVNICKPNYKYSSKTWLKMIAKNLSNQTILIESNKNVKCVSYKYL